MAVMNEEELAAWIVRRFGAPLLKVELAQEHICDAIEEAKRWFVARKGVKRARLLYITASQNDYILPEDVDTVFSVQREAQATDLTLSFSPYTLVDERVPVDVFGAVSSGGLYSTYVQIMQYTEEAQKIVSADPDWRQEGRTLWLFATPNRGNQFRISYKSNTITVEQLNERDHDLLKRYALACAKRDLGRIRLKYTSGFPSSTGDAQLDAQNLLTEAAEEMEILKTEVFDSQMPAGFLLA